MKEGSKDNDEDGITYVFQDNIIVKHQTVSIVNWRN